MAVIEITANYFNERFRFDNESGDVVIADAEHVEGEQPIPLKMFTIKGPEDESRPLTTHRSYRFYGTWQNYKSKYSGRNEKQFHFQTYVEAEPASRAGILSYLKEAGRGNGLGQAGAVKIWERFGSDSVRMLRESPEVIAAAVPRLSIDQAKVVAAVLEERKNVEHCSIQLMGLLDRRGFPKTTARRALALWGNQAAELIERNPYSLMRFRGCGFKGCDRFYLELGLPPGRLKRQALCAWHAIASDTNGHTWYPRGVSIAVIGEMIAGARPRPHDAIRLAVRGGMLESIETDTAGRIVDNGGRVYLAEAKNARSERYVARQVIDAESEPVAWPVADRMADLSLHQAKELGHPLQSSIGVFGGGPGTGKTYTAAALVKAICQAGDSEEIAIAAPTGKAAVRISEALNTYGIRKRAKTIHATLGVESSEDGWRFRHNENNPLPFRYLVIDESSMVDADLMSSLLAARGKGTHVLFVGDVCQLPPVGHGAPLRDLIRAGLPYGVLTEIKRNDGGIVAACSEIRRGREFKCEGNLVHNQAMTPNDQKSKVIEICVAAKRDGLDPVWDVQIVVPVNKKSPVSRYEMNTCLQEELNRNPGIRGTPFRTGDKIVNLSNGFYPSIESEDSEETQTNDRGEVYVANGELAEVLESTVTFTVARLSNPRRIVRIPRGKDSDGESSGCNWDLGYALSVHKSQGSEWPVVAVVIDEYPGAKMVCSREWMYTAISRAKSECHLVGQLATAFRFCRRTQIDERQTFLVEQINRERAAKVLAEL